MKQPLLQSAIVWPEEYLPGTTDNFASNEIIVSGLTAAQIWAQLDDTTLWPGYYSNVADIHFHDGSGPDPQRQRPFPLQHLRLPD